MINTKTLNKNVAVSPFVREAASDKPKARGLDLQDTTITKLLPAKVLYASSSFSVGDIVYFRSDVLRLPVANQKLQLGETTFVLMPEELVVLHETMENGIVPTPTPSAGKPITKCP